MAEASPAAPGSLLPAGTLLATKLFIPPPGPCLVERPRLLEKLNQALRPSCRLTLVSAPPGFGKTTLVSTWATSARAAQRGLPVAWLSLDEHDNDPMLFWSYICAALHGLGAQALLHSGQGTALEAALTALINDLAHLTAPVLLVLDDFHLIRSPAIVNSLGFVLDRMPP